MTRTCPVPTRATTASRTRFCRSFTVSVSLFSNPDVLDHPNNVPWIVTRTQEGIPNGRGGYTDGDTSVAAYIGREREAKRTVDPTRIVGQGPVTVSQHIII